MTILVEPFKPQANPSTESGILHRGLAMIGRDPQARQAMVELIRQAEAALPSSSRSVRDEWTGPLIDALHAESGILEKTLSNGLTLQFRYKSKIAREFVMSPQANPDHVWEPQTTRLLLHLSKDANNVVIGGAYMGDHAVLVAHQIQPHGGRCHAFEPNAEQAAMLEINAQANNLANLHVHRDALWSTSGELLTLVGHDAEAHGESVDDVDSHPGGFFTTITINDFSKAHKLDQIDVLMLDVEGAELPALHGADRYLAQPAGEASRIVFEIHSLYSDWSSGLENTGIVRYLRSFGYHVFAVRDYHGNLPMGEKPIEIIPPEETYLEGPPHGFNMLAVKQIELIDEKCFRLCRNVSPKLLPHKDPALHAPMDGWPALSSGRQGTAPG